MRKDKGPRWQTVDAKVEIVRKLSNGQRGTMITCRIDDGPIVTRHVTLDGWVCVGTGQERSDGGPRQRTHIGETT